MPAFIEVSQHRNPPYVILALRRSYTRLDPINGEVKGLTTMLGAIAVKHTDATNLLEAAAGKA